MSRPRVPGRRANQYTLNQYGIPVAQGRAETSETAAAVEPDTAEVAAFAMDPRWDAWRSLGFTTPDEISAWCYDNLVPAHLQITTAEVWLRQAPQSWRRDPQRYPFLDLDDLGRMSVAEALAWRQEGFGPGDAYLWRSGRFTAEDARTWHDAGFAPPAAMIARSEFGALKPAVTAWREAGFDGEGRDEWLGNGFTLKQAAGWCSLLIQNGFPPSTFRARLSDHLGMALDANGLPKDPDPDVAAAYAKSVLKDRPADETTHG